MYFFLHPQIPDFQIVVSRPNIVQSLQIIWKAYLFGFIHVNNNNKKDANDLFCHFSLSNIFLSLFLQVKPKVYFDGLLWTFTFLCLYDMTMEKCS